MRSSGEGKPPRAEQSQSPAERERQERMTESICTIKSSKMNEIVFFVDVVVSVECCTHDYNLISGV